MFNTTKKLKEQIKDLEKDNNDLLEKLEESISKSESLIIEYDKLQNHLDKALKAINNISNDLYTYKKYVEALKDEKSGLIVDYDAITSVIGAADQMLQKFDFHYSQNMADDVSDLIYPDTSLQIKVKRYADPNKPYEEVENV